MAYKFEWDPAKAKANKDKHQVTFEQAKTVFDDQRALFIFDERNSDYEERFNIIGFDIGSNQLKVCFCYRNGDEIIHIISARMATKKEQDLYWRQ